MSSSPSPFYFLGFTLTLFTLFHPVFMVKREDFKRCDQSGFCVRQRAYADIQDRLETLPVVYSLLVSTAEKDPKSGSLSADLMDVQKSILYKFSLSFIQSGSSIRVKLQEKNPIQPKFDFDLTPDLAFESEPVSVAFKDTKFKVVSPTELVYSLASDESTFVIIHPSPFRFEVVVKGTPVMSFNEFGYLNYEHQRKKEEDVEPVEEPETPEMTEAEKELRALKKKLRQGLWEESFGSNTDSKPYGPTSIGIDIGFPGSSHIYGIPQHASPFSLPTTKGPGATYSEPYRLYNFDVFEYEINNPMALYGSVPFMMSHKSGASVGVFWLNAAEMWVDVEKVKGLGEKLTVQDYKPFSTIQHTEKTSTHTHWMTESGILDLFIFLGPTPDDIYNSYTSLTGRPTMPQHFAIGYHQCRWNYLDEQDVADVDTNFDVNDIPYDVLWLDIEHTDGKKYFTWDSLKFPTPDKMQEKLSVKGRKMVTIVDPHIKRDDSFYVSKQAKDLNLFVKNAKNEDFEGWCWPGSSNWIDYLNPAGRSYWAEQFKFDAYQGSTPSLYTWNDMNEPSVFSGPEITMPKDNLHFGLWEHRDVHNIYGALQHRATAEGHLLRSNNNDRPFVLSRAFFSGTQRWGAIWTGDNAAQWEHLEASVPMLLSIGISGITFAGADVGGFFGNPDTELLIRWYQVGAFQPFFRAHAHIDTKRREPWLFGEPTTTLIKNAIRQRYRIMPYLYTLFWESNQNGKPIMRPLMSEFPNDEKTFALDECFMLGSSILVHPVVRKGDTKALVYLPPSSIWYDYETLGLMTQTGDVDFEAPLEKIPVFLRGGSILVRRDRIRRAVNLGLKDPYTLIIALDSKGEAKTTLYVDDGHSYDYKNGVYTITDLTYKSGVLESKPRRLLKGVAASETTLKNLSFRVERVVLLGLKTAPKSVLIAESGNRLEYFSIPSGDGVIVAIKDPKVLMGHSWKIHIE